MILVVTLRNHSSEAPWGCNILLNSLNTGPKGPGLLGQRETAEALHKWWIECQNFHPWFSFFRKTAVIRCESGCVGTD
jgi:hypothetical protein